MVVLIILCQNLDTGEVRILFWSPPMPRALWLILMWGFGFAMGLASAGFLLSRRCGSKQDR